MTAVESERTPGSPADDPVTPEVIDDTTPASPPDGSVTPDPDDPAGDASTDDTTGPRQVNDPPPPDVPAEGGSEPAGPEPAEPEQAEPSAAEPEAASAEPEAAPGTAAPPVVPPTPPTATPPTATPPRRRHLLAAVVLVLVGALLGGIAGGLAVDKLRSPAPTPVTPPAPDLVSAVAGVLPAVFRLQAGAPDTGTAGTAVALTPTGDVVTNEHLVHGETSATLIGSDGQHRTARVVATDEKADLAWLRIDGGTNLPVARLTGADSVRLGEDVVAIGNALNLDGAPSISRGVVSAVGRSTQTLTGVIQTDAAISSGSSGGALIDPAGDVVGITTEAVVGDQSVSVEDIAFAIPSDRVVAVLAGMGLVLPPGR